MKQADRWETAVVAKLAMDDTGMTAEELAVNVPGAVNVASDFYGTLRSLKVAGVIVEQPGQNGRASTYTLVDYTNKEDQ